MSPLGKFTLALLGLRCFGATGFFAGLVLGHVLIDRTAAIKWLESRLAILDDNLRLLLPYRVYKYYNRIEGNFWGKLWGGLLGGLLFGFHGFIFLFIVGHFVFDTPNSRHARHFRAKLDAFFEDNLGKIGGGVIGFGLKSQVLLFVGVILGFFYDQHRAGVNSFKFLKNLWRHHLRSKEELIDEQIREIAKSFVKLDGKAYKKAAKRLKLLLNGDLEKQEEVIEKLLRLAYRHGEISAVNMEVIRKSARVIGLPRGNFEALQAIHQPRRVRSGDYTVRDCYSILGILKNASDIEIKKRWKELIYQYHPDRVQARGASREELEASTLRMAEINAAYEEVMRSRKVI